MRLWLLAIALTLAFPAAYADLARPHCYVVIAAVENPRTAEGKRAREVLGDVLKQGGSQTSSFEIDAKGFVLVDSDQRVRAGELVSDAIARGHLKAVIYK
jgi:hypothetical protein